MISETFSVPAEGCELRVRRAEVEGFPTLLVHGGPGGTDYLFKYFARQLAKLDHQAIGYIQRGSPGSPYDGPLHIEQFVADLESVRVALGHEKLALIAHSWGGLLSTLYAARHPECVARLVLICPIGARAGWREAFNAALEDRMTPEDLTEWRRLGEEAASAATFEEETRLVLQQLNLGVRYYYGARFRPFAPALAHLEWRVRKAILGGLDALYADPSWERGLARLAAPCALFTGEEDPMPPSVAREYLALLPNADRVEIPEAGHFPWMEDPIRFYPPFREAMRAF